MMRIFFLVLMVFCSFSIAQSAPELFSKGELVTVESDGSLVIDGKGYLASGSVRVENGQGKPVSLRDLKLPTAIRFAYRYTPRGPVVTRIKEGSAIPE